MKITLDFGNQSIRICGDAGELSDMAKAAHDLEHLFEHVSIESNGCLVPPMVSAATRPLGIRVY